MASPRTQPRKRPKAKAKRKQIPLKARRALKRFEQRLNARRQAWDQEDSQLRFAMAAAFGGNDWQSALKRMGQPGLRTAGEMSNITARYDSALTTDDNADHWAMADGLAADAAANPMIRYTLRNRARYEVANNCYAMGVGESIANDFVGTGPRLHIEDDRLTDEEKEDIETKWLAWSNTIGLAAKARTMRKAKRQDGEAFAVKITNNGLNHPIKLDLKLIEADQVRFVDISLLLTPSVDGIRYDDYGNPVAYHILRVHPGFWSYATGYVGMPWEYDIWDAKLVIHWFRADRPGQHRGIPEILPALPLYATLRRYTQATLDAAETAADYAVLLETQSGAEFVDSDGDDIGNEALAAFSTAQLSRRMMATLPAGYQAKQFHPEQPTQQYSQFKREICGEIGRCEGVPMNVILGDSSNSSFASGQLDHRIYFRPREIERSEFEVLCLDSLLSDWISEGVRIRDGNGDMGKPYLPQILRELGSTVRHTWYWDSNQMGNPLQLAAAASTALKDGLTTIPLEYEKKGLNWQRAFRSAARALGISVEQYQELVRNSQFAARGTEPVDASEDEGGEAGKDKPATAPTPQAQPRPQSAVKRPQQAAMQKVTQ